MKPLSLSVYSSIEKPLDLTGPLALNSYLDKAERILEGRLGGPEHILVVGKDLYTGLNTGEVVRINGNHITHVAKFGQPCEGHYEERKCGRPLGMVHDAVNNRLIVADAYYGIWEVDLKNGGAKKQLISPEIIVQGENPRKCALFNSVALASNGDIYFTDSSSEFGLEDGLFTVMANPSGRLIHWDRKKNVATALIDELAFANGLLLSPNEEFIVVSETQRALILKYFLRGAKKGTWEPFVTGLPGHTDNLMPSGTNGFWVPLITARDSENPSLMASLAQVPLVRKFLLRMLYLIEFPLKMINQVYPNEYTQKAAYWWGSFGSASWAFPPRTTLVKVDWTGKVVGALHGMDKSVHSIAHVAEDGDYLYLGGPFINYMGRVKLDANAKKLMQLEEKVKAAPPPPAATTTTPPPPTTTTPKPTTTTTTTPPPPTTTTTPKPATTTTTTPKPTTTTPKPATKKPATKESEPAPVYEQDPKDAPPPKAEKLKVIKKGNVQEEL